MIRRILRRAVRYGFTFLNTKEPFIHKLVAVLADQMGEFFPEIKAQQSLVTNVIKEEEASFLRTLDQGLEIFEKEFLALTTTVYSPENKVIFMKEKISYNPENNLKPYLQKFGEPQLILFSTQMSNSVRANVFLNQGLVIFTHIKDQSVQEIWRFEPTTQEIFMNTWGKTLSTEENGPEAF